MEVSLPLSSSHGSCKNSTTILSITRIELRVNGPIKTRSGWKINLEITQSVQCTLEACLKGCFSAILASINERARRENQSLETLYHRKRPVSILIESPFNKS